MREFSLLHNRFRQVPVIVAIVGVGAVLFLLQSNNDDAEDPNMVEAVCPSAIDCKPEAAPSALPSNPAPAVEAPTTTLDQEWSNVTPSGRDVPFISLQPSPDGVTDAGRELMAEAGAQRPADGVNPAPPAPGSTGPKTVGGPASSDPPGPTAG